MIMGMPAASRDRRPRPTIPWGIASVRRAQRHYPANAVAPPTTLKSYPFFPVSKRNQIRLSVSSIQFSKRLVVATSFESAHKS